MVLSASPTRFYQKGRLLISVLSLSLLVLGFNRNQLLVWGGETARRLALSGQTPVMELVYKLLMIPSIAPCF